MRKDAVGLFWEDHAIVKEKKVKEKRQPPERVWERPDYLPGLSEALRFDVGIMTDGELWEAAMCRHKLLMDLEIYPNYFCAVFRSFVTGKVLLFELYDGVEMNLEKLMWVTKNCTLATFNGIKFDIPILSMALAGCDNYELKHATNLIIVGEEQWVEVNGKMEQFFYKYQPWDIARTFKVRQLRGLDHIDLIEVAPLEGSLKAYAGRLHAPRLQDLPFNPDIHLSLNQIAIIRWYCVNDLTSTGFLYVCLEDQIQLREQMTVEYGIDLRSKSDAQIAEAVIAHEYKKVKGVEPTTPQIAPGTTYKYWAPDFIKFHTPMMNWVLERIKLSNFVVNQHGKVGLPQTLEELDIPIAKGVYRMGIGGLHSTEKSTSHYEDDEYIIRDFDVTSFYPMVILLLCLFPQHLGTVFLTIYNGIVQKRISAKKAKNNVVADALKIVVNGSYGKFGNRFSGMYSPDLVIQTTLTGQLSLLMLIERLELAGIQVISANTDGIVIKCRRTMEPLMREIIAKWELETKLTTEETKYKSLHSRDVNNYIALKHDGSTKNKGVFNNPWEKGKFDHWCLHKNPFAQVSIEAVCKFLFDGTPMPTTIRACKDVRKFVVLRAVKGGACKDGIYLGKNVRWYHAKNETSEIQYIKTGNRVAGSAGGKPMMDMLAAVPDDIDLEWYDTRAEKLLAWLGGAKDKDLGD